MAETHEIRNVIIIGSGPAGYTSALYTARALLRPLCFAGYAAGGQLMLTSEVENFPGYPKGIEGPEMMKQLKEQAIHHGAEIYEKDVSDVDFSAADGVKKVTVEGKDYYAKSIIIATGAEAIWLNAEGEAKHKGRGVSTCATCDGAFFKDKEVLVIGGGDSAMEEATFLTRYCSKVTLINRRDVYRASKVMVDRARNNPKIEMKPFYQVKAWLSGNDKGSSAVVPATSGGFGGGSMFNIAGGGGGGFSIGGGGGFSAGGGGSNDDLTGCTLIDTRDNSEVYHPCDGAFIAIGHTPITKFLAGSGVETDKSGYIVHQEHTMTNMPGVFAAGDVVDTRYRQAITAAGMGCQAAIDCERWLEDQECNHE